MFTHNLDSSSEETRPTDEINIQDQMMNASSPERNDHLIKENEHSALNTFEYTAIYNPTYQPI